MTTQTDDVIEQSLPCPTGLCAQQAAELDWLLPHIARKLGMAFLKPSTPEITLRQMHVCMLLESGPLTISEISRELEVCLSAATQIADRLEKSGMVERIPTRIDRRAKYLQLTLQGSTRMREWREQRFQRAYHVLSHLSQECRIEVLHILSVLAAAEEESSMPTLQAL